MKPIKWHRSGDGEQVSEGGRFRLVSHRLFNPKARGVNLLVNDGRGGWTCDDSYPTFREAKLAVEDWLRCSA